MHYLIDRKNDYYYVEGLHFPLDNDKTFQDFHRGTLIDGELVNDIIEQRTQLKYLVFDCLLLDHKSLMHRTLDKRLAYFRDKVYNPWTALYKKYPEEIQHLPFIVQFKKMELGYGIEMMFRQVLPNLPHGNDGLIFTCRNSPYKHGTDEHILKWKPARENSIDFRLELQFPLVDPDSEDEAAGIYSPQPDYDAMPTMHLLVNHDKGTYQRFGYLHMEEKEWESLKGLNEPLDDRLVECAQDDAQRWRFLRFRDDKKEANHISTVNSVMESIMDRVGEGDLIRAAGQIRKAWKERAARAEQEARRPPINGEGEAKRLKIEDA